MVRVSAVLTKADRRKLISVHPKRLVHVEETDGNVTSFTVHNESSREIAEYIREYFPSARTWTEV